MTIKQEIKKLETHISKEGRNYTRHMKPHNIKLSRLKDKLEFDENKKLIGKCFKYRNSYGQDEKWWLYYKVLDHVKDDNHYMKTLAVQMPNLNREVEMKIENVGKYMFRNDTIEISQKEFDKHYNKMLKLFVEEKSD